MAFRVDIEYEPNVERNGTVVLTATVIDTDTGEETTEEVEYEWTHVGAGTRSVNPATPHITTYTAAGFGVDDVPASVLITCTATITDITPDASEISTSVLANLGINNIDVNMLMVANVDGDFLYNGENDSVEPGSETNFYDTDTLNVHQIIWRESSSGSHELVIVRDPLDGDLMTTMRTYWIADGNLPNKSVFIIAPDGTVLEFDDSLTSVSDITVNSITYTVPAGTVDIDIVNTMNRIVSGQAFVMGVGDSHSATGVDVTESETVTVSVLGDIDTESDAIFSRKVIEPIIQKITAPFLNTLTNNTAFNSVIGITQKPRAAYGIITIRLNNTGQQYIAKKTSINLSTRLDGVDRFTESLRNGIMSPNYIVFLQRMADIEYGGSGRVIPTYSVYDKTITTFSISYQEGIPISVFGGDPPRTIISTLQWFARGY